jgi:hypothetical protein
VALFDTLAGLPIEVESYELEGLERDVSSDFTRLSTVIHLHGKGEEGVGEDVVYDALDHIALQETGPVHDLTGPRTLKEFCDLIHELELFPTPPVREVSPLYRRWAFESAALDLALRQSETTLHEHLGIAPSRSRSWSHSGSATRRPSSQSATGWTRTRRCASSSTR